MFYPPGWLVGGVGPLLRNTIKFPIVTVTVIATATATAATVIAMVITCIGERQHFQWYVVKLVRSLLSPHLLLFLK